MDRDHMTGRGVGLVLFPSHCIVLTPKITQKGFKRSGVYKVVFCLTSTSQTRKNITPSKYFISQRTKRSRYI